jgi:uncharacterized cupredoxin-like copper-binding protein
MTRFTTRQLIATGSASALLLLTACGSDDDANANAEACDAWVDADAAVINYLFSGQGDADSVNAAIDAAIDAADPDIEQTLIDLKAAAQPGLADPESEEGSDETVELYGEAIAWAGDNCGFETLDVTAVEYEYDGVPEELSTGYHVVNFSNEGQEQHELLAFKINDGVTESLDELFELSDEEIEGKITMVNAVFAPPGSSDTGSWNLASPGNYAIVCFVPVGSVGETEGDGPPHFVEGMVQEFTVT